MSHWVNHLSKSYSTKNARFCCNIQSFFKSFYFHHLERILVALNHVIMAHNYGFPYFWWQKRIALCSYCLSCVPSFNNSLCQNFLSSSPPPPFFYFSHRKSSMCTHLNSSRTWCLWNPHTLRSCASPDVELNLSAMKGMLTKSGFSQ